MLLTSLQSSIRPFCVQVGRSSSLSSYFDRRELVKISVRNRNFATVVTESGGNRKTVTLDVPPVESGHRYPI